MHNFTGSKIALFYQDKLVVSLRDDIAGLNCAGMWDLPGGEREGSENPVECIQRELYEELGIRLSPESLLWTEDYPSIPDQHGRAHFFVASIDKEVLDAVSFGDEGQGWRLMDPLEFVTHEDAIPYLKARVADYLAASN